MSMRNITVNNVTFRYVIGRSFVKIVPPNSAPLLVQREDNHGKPYPIGPGEVARYIKEQHFKEKVGPRKCKHCGTEKDVVYRVNPFQFEIYNKIFYRWTCIPCNKAIAEDI